VTGNMSIAEVGLGSLAAGMKESPALLNAVKIHSLKALEKVHCDVLWRRIFVDMPKKRRITRIKKLGTSPR